MEIDTKAELILMFDGDEDTKEVKKRVRFAVERAYKDMHTIIKVKIIGLHKTPVEFIE